MTRFLCLLALFTLNACSTVIDKSTQEVKFVTPGAAESRCYLDTGRVSYKVNPPEKIILMKTDQELEVRCLADGNREREILVRPILSNHTLLNLGTGFVPGFFIDEHTKAHYLYPDVVSIDFTNIPYEKTTQPVYAQNPATPNVQNIDPKHGGIPAIHESDYDASASPAPRQSRSYYTDTPESSLYQPASPKPEK